jgi:SAM-dependent methyltransferase
MPVAEKRVLPQGHLQTSLDRCLICDSSSLEIVNGERFDLARMPDLDLSEYDGLTFNLNECGDCGFIQPDWIPSRADFFFRLYNQQFDPEGLKKHFSDRYRDFIYAGILNFLEKLCPGPKRKLVDVGTGVGRFPFLAGARGWDALGCETNARSVTAAKAVNPTPVINESFEQFLNRDARFQVVTFLDVLEHIPQPMNILREAFELLEPSGWIVIKVPHGKNQLLKQKVRGRLSGKPAYIADNMVHINHFGPQSLKQALERTGFGNVRVHVGAPEFHDGHRLISRAFNAAVYGLARLMPFGERTPLAFNLTAYAQKP